MESNINNINKLIGKIEKSKNYDKKLDLYEQANTCLKECSLLLKEYRNKINNVDNDDTVKEIITDDNELYDYYCKQLNDIKEQYEKNDIEIEEQIKLYNYAIKISCWCKQHLEKKKLNIEYV